MPGVASQSDVGILDKPFPDLLKKRSVNVGSDARIRNTILSVLNATAFDWISVIALDVGNKIFR